METQQIQNAKTQSALNTSRELRQIKALENIWEQLDLIQQILLMFYDKMYPEDVPSGE